jgi:HEAT repeat protein
MKSWVMFCTACAILSGAQPEALVRQVAGYDFGSDTAAVRELETLTLHTAGSKDAAAIEKLLLSGLGSARTAAAKDAFCRDLAIVGSDSSVPKLTIMLGDPDTAEPARYALERIPGAQAAAALRGALARTSANVQTGIVVSLGRRRDQASVGAIKPLLTSKDARMASAAAAALGNIATPEAREALLAASPSPAVSGALLQIAERSGADAAISIYLRLNSTGLNSAGQSEAVQAAALEALARVDARQAAPLLHAALQSGRARLQGIAVRELARLEGVALAREIPRVPERARVQIISALTDSGRPDVRPVLLQGAASDSEAVRVASLNGLAKLGTAADVAMLAGRAAAATGDEQAAARAALGGIPGTAADAAILLVLPAAEPKTKVELIHAVGQRGIASAAGVLLAAAADANRAVRVESVRALRETAGSTQLPALLALLVKASNENERRELERALAAAIRRSRESPVGDVIEAYKSVREASVRAALLSVMSAAGNSEALPVIRQALQDPSADIQRAALNALSGWPTPAPVDDLLALARSAGEPTRRILALRGYIKLVQIPSNRTPAQTAGLLKTAMAIATMPDEKRAVLAVAQRVVCPESLALARSALNDPQVAAEAELAATTLERGLSFVRK